MTQSLLFRTLMLAALALAGTAAAAPTADTYPEVIPGEGLPSLESLGLTSADLYKMDYKSLLTRRDPNPLLEARFDLNCNGQKCQANDAAACVNYLASLGGQLCPVLDDQLHMTTVCTIGSARIVVHQLSPGAVSTCGDVARGGGFIMDSCTQFGLTAGQAPAYGNGNFIVDIALVNT